jgi:hypothetical protein
MSQNMINSLTDDVSALRADVARLNRGASDMRGRALSAERERDAARFAYNRVSGAARAEATSGEIHYQERLRLEAKLARTKQLGEWIERDRREPDKVLMYAQELQR